MNRWVLGARPRTLPAAVVPVVVGTAAAVGGPGGITWWRAGAAMVVALAVQVFTNYQNDYADGVRGTDDHRVGPVRLVAGGLATAKQVRTASLVAAVVAGLAGLALAIAVNPVLLLVGAASLAAGYFYTGGPRPYGYAGYGEAFVFVFFGLVATVGSAYVQSEQITLLAVVAAVPVGLLATALLVVNNLRDIPTDSVTGKRTLAVRLGDRRIRSLYAGLLVVAFASLPLLAIGRRPALLGLLAIPFALRPLRTVARGALGPALVPVLGDTGRLQLIFGILLGAGLALGG
ncbi:MAG TPA: 1,4-dihydroxy-2-naphthoate polyprenyltransferase [Acidimicrobiales bacterium]